MSVALGGFEGPECCASGNVTAGPSRETVKKINMPRPIANLKELKAGHCHAQSIAYRFSRPLLRGSLMCQGL